MKKYESADIPFVSESRDLYDFSRGLDCFDPLGSYTGRTPDTDEIPVQDADDL